jgi:hypothetical protein
VHGIAQHADDFGGQNGLQDFNGFLDIALIGEGDRSGIDMLARTFAQGLDIAEERLGAIRLFHVFSLMPVW